MPGSPRRLVSAGVVLLVAFAALSATLLLIGQNAVVVTHGVSMNPVYYQGDLVVVQRQATYAKGDIVAYPRPELDLIVLHRIIGGDPMGWVLQGDNNQSIDPTTPAQSELLGRAVVHVPRGGLWLRRLTSPPLLAAYTFLLLLGGSAARTRRRRRKDLRMSPRHSSYTGGTLGALAPALRPVAAGAAALGLAGLALSGVAWTTPSERSVEAASSTTSSMRFSYVADVPRSAAYDGTTVTAPQPVFRNLTDRVDVSYSYSGLPGTLEVRAELSTPGGWATTIPLGAAEVGRTYDGTARLDLVALARRAAAAAEVTGLPAGEVEVAVVPEVSLAGGGTFAPRFELRLTDLVLEPTGDDLTAEDTSTTTGSRLAPTQLRALGQAMTVSTARTVGAVGLLLSLLAAAAVVVVARRTGPLAEAERVRARYGELLLPVLPVALVGGRPVVDVPDVDSLARLAERYGLLVLHWSRGGTDTYVVQDESTTFRYRTAPHAENGDVEPTTSLLQPSGA